MTDLVSLRDLKDLINQSSTREDLDKNFKKWRLENLLPIREKISLASSPGEKKKLGLLFKELSEQSQEIYEEKKQNLSTWLLPFYSERESANRKECLIQYSSKNLLSELFQDVIDFFLKHNFVIYEESEIVKVSDNFDSLLIPEGHPARASSDSFFLSSEKNEQSNNTHMLRTHTTTSTLKLLEKYSDECFRGVSFGPVYRKEDNNSTHLSQFTQVDLVWVGKELNLDHLRQLIEKLLFSLLKTKKRTYRLRSSYFPFTSPSYEVDLSCDCKLNAFCKLCGGTGWIEILGCGFLREEILNKTHKGHVVIAAGLGLERIGMIRYSLEDIRDFYKNDFRKTVIKE